MTHLVVKVILVSSAVVWTSISHATAESPRYSEEIRPLLKKYCYDCHAGETTEAEIDFDIFKISDDLRKQPKVWLKTRHILNSGQMPPKDSPQPTADERKMLETWVGEFLRREAEATAGDPGPVLLRRLNNEEYNYTVRDLTGLSRLYPTREFPVEGAAGEGFINTGSAQSMSPAMVGKYLEAAKEVSSHLVLMPDGIAFSEGQSRRERTNERLGAIREFYDRYTVPTEVYVEVGGTGKVANVGGAIPLKHYLAALFEERNALNNQSTTIEAVSNERSLNAKYLGLLWNTLQETPDKTHSVLMSDLRARWRHGGAADVIELMTYIEQFQQQLWTFNSIGQLTEGGKQKIWMSTVSPIVTQQELRLPLQPSGSEPVNRVYLSASDLGDGREQDYVVYDRPRLEFQPDAFGVTHPPILMRDFPGLVGRIQQVINKESSRTPLYLKALAKHHSSKTSIEEIAQQSDLNTLLLKHWVEFVGFGHAQKREILGRFTSKLTNVAGHPELNGWGSPQTPSVLTNTAKENITVTTLTIPARGVVVHPSPTQESVIAWQCPKAGRMKIAGRVADADHQCGNGAAWRVELLSETGQVILTQGAFDNGQGSQFQLEDGYDLKRGDVISLIVNARDKSHVCDTTHVELKIIEEKGEDQKWVLSADVVDRILDSNPLADSYGNTETWHFCAKDSDQASNSKSMLIPGSAISQWRAAVLDSGNDEEISRLAERVQRVMLTDDPQGLSDPDRSLQGQLRDWKGPLRWIILAQINGESETSEGNYHFGRHPNGATIDAASLCVQAPQILEFRIPDELIAGADFVAGAELHADSGRNGTVQVQVSSTKPQLSGVSPALPFLVGEDGLGKSQIKNALIEFRNLFPPAVCYSRIVPVDEVVTMTLYFREDEHLQRLLLHESAIEELERLWSELLYVSQEPIAMTVVFEQIYEFATQDRPDLVKAFEPMREPINRRADLFRKTLIETEPFHLDAVIELAGRAWRRKLSDTEKANIRQFYSQLRATEIAHEDSIRLTLTRVLTSPAFLYRREQPVPGSEAGPVSNTELATRLSYFLWSSLPDAELRQLADSGQLVSEETLLAQTHRMLKDARTERLAIQFACQWLHLRNFDQNNDKNEKLYPEFAELRGQMYEETVRFFEEMFRNDGSILDLIDADHSFMNESLAKYYGVEGVTGPEWRRVVGLHRHERGGILGMASFLASQSGASRTSPILRGNWVYETLLGERLPRPPANVPQLPESVPEGLTSRQMIEMHSSAAACAKCHEKIDHFGFALEQFDAIGRQRPGIVDVKTRLPEGTEIEGINGLRHYLLNARRDDVVRQFCKKLLGFALGRELQLSDELLLEEMQKKLKAKDYRFSVAIEAIVTSTQFRQIRGTDFPDSDFRTGVDQ